MESLNLRGTQLEPTKSLCKLKIKVFEFGALQIPRLQWGGAKTHIDICNSAKKNFGRGASGAPPESGAL